MERNPQRDCKMQKMLAENNDLLSQESRDLRNPWRDFTMKVLIARNIETQQTWISWINRMILQKHFPRGDLFQDLFGTVKGGRMGL